MATSLRFYVYISASKLDMLAEQISTPLREPSPRT